MEIHAIEVANEMNAEYWSVSSKTGRSGGKTLRLTSNNSEEHAWWLPLSLMPQTVKRTTFPMDTIMAETYISNNVF